jgi:aspartate oxidase
MAIARCALQRRESRGGHLRTDCPAPDSDLDGIHFVLSPSGEVSREEWQ